MLSDLYCVLVSLIKYKMSESDTSILVDNSIGSDLETYQQTTRVRQLLL